MTEKRYSAPSLEDFVSAILNVLQLPSHRDLIELEKKIDVLESSLLKISPDLRTSLKKVKTRTEAKVQRDMTVKTTIVDQIVAMVQKYPNGISPKDLAKAVGMNIRTIHYSLAKAFSKGLITKKGKGIYAAVD
ncbi:MAG: hypothetical protein HQK60_06770 [Deltaproteobacteria bacterium]|nr:hypothetical protein [Deltaproteobacteria bacterium]